MKRGMGTRRPKENPDQPLSQIYGEPHLSVNLKMAPSKRPPPLSGLGDQYLGRYSARHPYPLALDKFHAGMASHIGESLDGGTCDAMKHPRTRYLSIRVTPGFDAFLKVIADEFGMPKSRYARIVLLDDLKRHKARHHVLGWDRQRKP